MTAPRRSIANVWHSYDVAIPPGSTGVVRRRERRRAFYASAQGLLEGLLGGVTPGEEEADGELMADLEVELGALLGDVRPGRT